jgi:putative nucleotidyltransferase with HDIG domain
MRIPSKTECYQLIHEMDMMDHIVAHSLLVCQVATFLVDRMEIPGKHLNRDMVQASALLHDITKTRSFKTKEDHARTGALLLTEMGYPEVGYIIGQHVRLDHYFASETPVEAEIVNYADKRVLHDKVVSLKERMTYILEKYVKTPEHRERFCRLWERTRQLEDRIFNCLPLSPEELNHLFESADSSSELLTYRKMCGEL